uniref:Cas1_AcylT domain-containing protein n=1 Tax=Macrostomum lignano TaxID=282301 RepID=A0A1I8F2F4_9PLAT
LVGLLACLSYTAFAVLCPSKQDCNSVHPLLVVLPILGYACVRNVWGSLRQRYSYHVWLSNDTSGLLVLIPSNYVLNLITTSFIFVCLAHEVHSITRLLTPYAVPDDWRLAMRNLLIFCAVLVPIGVTHGAFSPAMPAAVWQQPWPTCCCPILAPLSYLSWLYYLYLPAITCLPAALPPLTLCSSVNFPILLPALAAAVEMRHRWSEILPILHLAGRHPTALGFWATFGRLWHGYEQRSGLLIVYHGVFPLDVYFLVARLTDRQAIHSCPTISCGRCRASPAAARHERHAWAPWRPCAMRCARAASSIIHCRAACGEALWSRRRRLRAVAISAGAPIYPVFTTNIREGIFCFRPGLGLLRPAVRADPPAAGDHAGLFPRQAAYLHRPGRCCRSRRGAKRSWRGGPRSECAASSTQSSGCLAASSAAS